VDFAKRGAAIASAHFGGMLVSGLLSGVLADVWGRRSTLLLGLTCNTIVGTLSAMARNATELCLLRFTCGLGLGMVISGVVTLSAEISPPSRRGRFMTLVASCYTLGFLYISLWAVIVFKGSGSGNWRLFMFVNVMPTIIAALLVTLFVPESPRFYLCRGRLREAVEISNLLAVRMGFTDKDNLLTEEELTQYLIRAKGIGQASSRGRETIQINEIMQNEEKSEYVWREIWTSLTSIGQVFTNGMYKVTIPLQFAYMSLTLVTGVSTWWTKIFQNLHLQTDAFTLSFYHTLGQIPGMMLASGLIDLAGRKRLVIIGFGGGSIALMFLSSTAKSIHSTGKDIADGMYSIVVLGLACFYSIFLSIGWLSIECLSTESFPTRVRSTGRGVCVASGRIAGFSVQFMYGYYINQNEISTMLAMASALAVFGVIVACQTTDTTNVDLQDHWDNGKGADETFDYDANGVDEIPPKSNSFADKKHSKYFSIESA